MSTPVPNCTIHHHPKVFSHSEGAGEGDLQAFYMYEANGTDARIDQLQYFCISAPQQPPTKLQVTSETMLSLTSRPSLKPSRCVRCLEAATFDTSKTTDSVAHAVGRTTLLVSLMQYT